jgi:hypothetical protein
VEIITYALAVVGALTVASCLAFGIGLALNQSDRSRQHSGHTPGGLVLPPPGSNGLWGDNDPRIDQAVDVRRRRPLTADQQATRDAWARWRAGRAETHLGDN